MKYLDKNFYKSLKIVSYAKSVFQRFGPREKFIAGLFALVILGSLVALGVQFYISKTQAVPAPGGEYREAVVGTPRFINPVLSTTNEADRDLVQLIYSGLMKYNKEGEIVPALAEKYEVSEDGQSYTFTLKENLVWEDGTPLTVEDVLFTIRLIQDPQYASPLFQSWQGVEAHTEDEHTIVFTLSSPYAPFIENTTIGIMPRHIWEDVSPRNFALTDLNLSPTGAGPYKVEKFTKDNSGFISGYSLEINENYHGQKPYIKRVTLKYYSSEQDALEAYNSKAVDGISILSPANIQNIEDVNSTNIHTFEMPRYFAIFINQDKNELLEEKSVRQAIALAINRDKIIQDALGGFGKKANSPIPETIEKYHNKNIEGTEYNPQRAIEILQEAGWQDENENGVREKTQNEATSQLSFTMVTADRPELVNTANIIQQQLREVGIMLNLQITDISRLQQSVIKTRNYEMLMFGEILGSIPDPFSFWHSSQKNDPGLNLANYENSDVDTLLEDARQQINKDEEIAKYKEFQEKVTNDLPVIFLYNPPYLYPINKRVQGVDEAFIIDTSLRFVDIENWYIETKRIF